MPCKPSQAKRRSRDEVDRLVRENIGLAHKESIRWGGDLHEDERLAAGMRGLARGCEIWDERKGKLSTIVSWYVRAECTLERRTGRRKESVFADCPSVEGEGAVTDVAADPRAPQPGDEVEHAEYVGQLPGLLSQLDDRSASVLRMRFGVGCEAMGLEVVGERFGVTKERVRQIQIQAITKLRELAMFTGDDAGLEKTP